MPVAVHISPQHMTKDDYDRMISELEATGSAEPEGRMFHAAYGTDHVTMFEVWRSEEEFKAHRNQTVDVLQGAGFDPGIVRVHPVHSEHPD